MTTNKIQHVVLYQNTLNYQGHLFLDQKGFFKIVGPMAIPLGFQSLLYLFIQTMDAPSQMSQASIVQVLSSGYIA